MCLHFQYAKSLNIAVSLGLWSTLCTLAEGQNLWYACQCWAEEETSVCVNSQLFLSKFPLLAWGWVCHSDMIPKPSRAHMCFLSFQHLISMHTECCGEGGEGSGYDPVESWVLPEVIAADGSWLCERSHLSFIQTLDSTRLNPSPHLLAQLYSPSLAGLVERIVLKYGARPDDTVSFVAIKGGWSLSSLLKQLFPMSLPCFSSGQNGSWRL